MTMRSLSILARDPIPATAWRLWPTVERMEVVRTKFVREMLANREVVFERQRLQHLSKVKVSGMKNESEMAGLLGCVRAML